MKKIFTIFTIFTVLFSLRAQERNSQQESGSERKNDILADPILLISVPMINVSYERLISQNMGIGVNAMITLNDDVDDFRQVSPYFRYYLGRKYASGFFFEGFVPITNSLTEVYTEINENNYYSYNYAGDQNITTVGVGFGVGGKWVIKDKLVIEASGGIARRFGDFNKYNTGGVTGKIMAGIGYRF